MLCTQVSNIQPYLAVGQIFNEFQAMTALAIKYCQQDQ